MTIEQINQLKQGSIISESSHYIVNRVSGSNAWLTHFESGTPGIRSIWENIHSGQVFTVCFKKQDKPKESGIRPVNIKRFIFNDVKYIVE